MQGKQSMPSCCYIGKMHHTADSNLWFKVMTSRKHISRAFFVSSLLKPRFLQMSELSHGSIKKKSQKLDSDCSLKSLLNFKESNEARIRCSWVWKKAVETGVACQFEFNFDVQASQGKQGQSWWAGGAVQVH